MATEIDPSLIRPHRYRISLVRSNGYAKSVEEQLWEDVEAKAPQSLCQQQR